ncbi:ATP-grasp domain-containing protein [Undibacterium sp. TC4M20W]|uniref:ATP-grasp domain-containing protein n=1 Tax=Undibacterium sp. TC4M20W TaxID=3413052 RepID=UPI003BF2E5BF
MPNVLILGGRAPVALDHARRFSQQGWTVYIADSVPCRLSGWSSAVRASIQLAAPSQHPQAFIDDLNRAITQYQIDLLMPTCEEVFFLSRYRKYLPASVRVLVDDFDKLRTLHSKWHFLKLAEQYGGNPPPSSLVSSIDEARAWAGKTPLVLKPEYSRFGVHVRLYPQGMPDNEAPLGQQGAWVAQHFKPGRELCSYSVADQGRLLAHAVYEPRHRLGKSSSFYFAPYDAPQIREFVTRLVAAINYTGQISFDWIESQDGIPSVIECNPRAVSGVHLFGMQDALPAALAGRLDECVQPSATSPRMLAAIMLSAGLVQAVQKRKLRAWWADYQAAGEVIGIAQDRLTLLGALADMSSFALMAWQQKCSMREAATRDIEWDGQELAEP